MVASHFFAEALESRMLLSAGVVAPAIASPTGPNGPAASPTQFDVGLSFVNSLIVEGDTATLNGTFSDPTAQGMHSVQIDWGDGTTSPVSLQPGVSTFSQTHRYPDNKPGDAPFSVDALVTGSSSLGTGQTTLTVVNQLPTHIRVKLSKKTVASGKSELLRGSFSDPGPLDTHQVTINWGDQQQSTLDLGAGVLTFQASHVYSNRRRTPMSAAVEVSVLDGDSLPTFTGPASVSNFQFSQLDWYNQKNVLYAPNSSWGVLNVDVNADPAQQTFLNVTADAGHGPVWIVQNLPLDGNYTHQSVDFDIAQLGLASGTNLASLDFTSSVDSTLRASMPSGTMTSATVTHQVEIPATGLGKTGGPPPPPGSPTGVKVQGKVDETNSTPARPDVPSVQEDKNQCVPGAFARSISWLNVAHGLGLTKKVNGKTVPRTAQEIYQALVNLLDSKSDGERLALKAEALANQAKQAGKKAVTKLFDPGNDVKLPKNDKSVERDKSEKDLLKWMKRELNNGQDVEMVYDLGTTLEGGITGHIITITRIIQTDSGTYVEYRDDEAQGDSKKGDAGVKTGQLESDGKGGYTFRRKDTGAKGEPVMFKVKWAVSESVVDAEVTVKGKGK